MIVAIKILHLLALAAALGVGLSRLVIAGHMAKVPQDAAVFAASMKRLATISYAAILILWLTGLALWGLAYGFGSMGTAFDLKLMAATLLAALALFAWARQRAGLPLALPVARRIGTIMVASGTVAVATAVIAFGG